MTASIGRHIERGAGALESLLDREQDPYHLVGYRGYGRHDRVLVLARALQNENLPLPDPAHSKLHNMLSMLKRLESDPLPFARIRAHLGNGIRELTADNEGYLHAWLDRESTSAGGWETVRLELSDARHRAAVVNAPVLIPSPTATYAVISDLDDTVLQSEVSNFIRAAGMVLLENARTRLPFPGVAAFYRALQEGQGRQDNPIFYISSSPWNLYDVIVDFLAAQSIPLGPILLRDWDLRPSLLRNTAHKTQLINEVLMTFPSMRFILIGDSTQEDPEIYAGIVTAHPNRILAVYIRNVRPHPERSTAIQQLAHRVAEAGSTLVLADDTLTVASHAAAHGWILPDRLPEIREEKRADEGAGGKQSAPGLGQAEPVSPLVVDHEIDAAELE